MTPEDEVLLATIMTEDDALRRVDLITSYYLDADRAERTPRSILYFHLGVLAGMLVRFEKEKTSAETILDEIALCLDGQTWTADTFEVIAALVRQTGRPIADVDG